MGGMELKTKNNGSIKMKTYQETGYKQLTKPNQMNSTDKLNQARRKYDEEYYKLISAFNKAWDEFYKQINPIRRRKRARCAKNNART